jgi:two-component sensor histidine kinase
MKSSMTNNKSSRSNKINFKSSRLKKKNNNLSEDKWKILVIDDSTEIQDMTELVLKDFKFYGKSLEILKAITEDEAKDILKGEKDIAVIILDIVMENDDSGLKLIDYIRNSINENTVRIVIRTGHPGEAPEEEVFDKYNINDYREKSELTTIKLYTCLKSALRNYMDIKTIDKEKKEKEILLKEIHHRVKNNLQVIISLISLEQHSCDKDDYCTEILERIRKRIMSISFVHQLLYTSADYVQVNMSKHINNIINNCMDYYSGNIDDITLSIEVDRELTLNINEAIPLGLIVNELITNSYKHAFTNSSSGNITVKLSVEGNLINLTIGDNGLKLPEDFDKSDRTSVGMTIIKVLLGQIDATMTIDNKEGWKYFIIKKHIDR